MHGLATDAATIRSEYQQTGKQISTLKSKSKRLQQQAYTQGIYKGLKKTSSVEINNQFDDQQLYQPKRKPEGRHLKSKRSRSISGSSNQLKSQSSVLSINEQVKKVTEKVQKMKAQMYQKLKPKQKIQFTSLKARQKSKYSKQAQKQRLYRKFVDIIYQHYCRSQFNEKKITFDKVRTQIHVMSLTTFMHFCRDFQLTNKEMVQRYVLVKEFKMNSQNFKQINRQQFDKILSKIAQRCFAKTVFDQKIMNQKDKTRRKQQNSSSGNNASRVSQSLDQFQKVLNSTQQQKKQAQFNALKKRSQQLLYRFLQIDTLQKFQQKTKKLGIKYYPHQIQDTIKRSRKNIDAKPRVYSHSKSKSSDQQSPKKLNKKSPQNNITRQNNRYFSEQKLQRINNLPSKLIQSRKQQSFMKKGHKNKSQNQRKTQILASLSTSRPMQIRPPVFQLGYANLYKIKKGQKIDPNNQKNQRVDPLFQELSAFRLNKIVQAAKKTLDKQQEDFKQSVVIIKNSELNTRQQMKELMKLNPELKVDPLKTSKWEKLDSSNSASKIINKSNNDQRMKTQIRHHQSKTKTKEVQNPLSHLFSKEDGTNLGKLGIQQEIEEDLFLIQHLKNEKKKQFEQRRKKMKQDQEQQKLIKLIKAQRQ